MAETVTAAQAAARVAAVDTAGLGFGTSWPSALLRALGEREDWENLRTIGGLLTAATDLFRHPGVHYLSGFFGPVERSLRNSGANISFATIDFRRLAPLLEVTKPRVMATAASPPDDNGWCSLSLHAGGTVAELRRAGADPNRLLVVETSPRFPRTRGLPPEHRHALHVDWIDLLIEGDEPPFSAPAPEPSEIDSAIAEHARRYVCDGATLQTGIGSIPSAIAAQLADGDGGNYGIHTEMFTDGLMRLHEAGKVTNAGKGQFDGVSVATFAMGSQALYDWLEDNDQVAFLPVGLVNEPACIARNAKMVTINGALAIDIWGQVVADTINGEQYSGIGGAEDFVSGPGLSTSQRSLLCMPSTFSSNGALQSRIVPWFDAGTVITTPRHHVDVVVTEYGAAELEGRTIRQRGEALAQVAHPDFRDELFEAAARASGGRSPRPAVVG